MQEKAKNKIIIIGFALILFLFFIINLIKKDEQISITERRKLAQFPKHYQVENSRKTLKTMQ